MMALRNIAVVLIVAGSSGCSNGDADFEVGASTAPMLTDPRRIPPITVTLTCQLPADCNDNDLAEEFGDCCDRLYESNEERNACYQRYIDMCADQ